MAEIDRLLNEAANGNVAAASELTAEVYAELRRLAASYMRRERPGHTLQATALVHEAYLRLAGQRTLDWRNRAQLLGIAAQEMRRVLTDHARKHLSAKRGGHQLHVSLNGAFPDSGEAVEMLAIDSALTQLAAIDERQSRIVELRFFGGLTEDETAAVLGITARTVRRDWAVARAWLFDAISSSLRTERL